MITFVAALAASALAATVHHRKLRHAAKKTIASRLLRREQFALLALRSEMLHDFLVRAGTETPAFRDPRIVTFGEIAIGPTIADVDFLGSPIVRVRVRNNASRSANFLVTAHVRAADGRTARASAFVEVLGAGQSRTLELLCPSTLAPSAVTWTVMSL